MSDYAQDGACLGVALNLELFDFDCLRGFGDDIEGVGGAVGGGIGARGFCVVEAEEGDSFFCATRGMIEAGGETETAVVLGESLFLVPGGLLEKVVRGEWDCRTSALR